MAPRKHSSNVPTLPKLALGVNGCVCVDYEDPYRLSGTNLPDGLKKIVADRLADKTDSEWESDLDAGDASSGYGSGNDSDSDASERHQRSRRQLSRDGAREEINIRKDAKKYEDDYYGQGRKKADVPSKINWLAFGSRPGDFAMISYDKGQYYLGEFFYNSEARKLIVDWTDGTVFKRFHSLRMWLTPNPAYDKPVERSVMRRNGADIRIFLGAESTYFAVDKVTREMTTNMDAGDFSDWILDAVDPFDPRSTKLLILKRGYVPHSLVYGSNDMFCWISEKAYKVNDAFRRAFPTVERFLAFAKAKKMLDKVVSLPISSCLTHVNVTSHSSPARTLNQAPRFHTTSCQLLVECASMPCLRTLQISLRSTAHAGVLSSQRKARGRW
jgi:hypothetical protein